MTNLYIPLALGITITLSACVSSGNQPYHDDTETPVTPGLFTGQDKGDFTFTFGDKQHKEQQQQPRNNITQDGQPNFYRLNGADHRLKFPQYLHGHKHTDSSKCYYDKQQDLYFCSY